MNPEAEILWNQSDEAWARRMWCLESGPRASQQAGRGGLDRLGSLVNHTSRPVLVIYELLVFLIFSSGPTLECLVR